MVKKKDLELNAEIREETGNKLAALRKKGFIPAVVYGPGHKPLSIKIEYHQFEKVFEEGGESTIIKLKVKGVESKISEKNVLIHNVDKNPVDEKIIHIDFYQIRMDRAITTEVPLVFEGESPAVANLDGTLVKNINEVEVEALPNDLPHEIKLDISSLKTFEDIIRIKDLEIPQGVKVLTDTESTVALVTPPRTEEELAELEEKPEEEVEEVEKVGEEEEEEERVEREEKVESPEKEEQKPSSESEKEQSKEQKNK